MLLRKTYDHCRKFRLPFVRAIVSKQPAHAEKQVQDRIDFIAGRINGVSPEERNGEIVF
jgi:hypothetical protein